ncbi:transcriptional regulator [Shewanella maritima]|uniref:winged helix-turn-helix domain-containing protein n=1 Tax=Shewanella maritima TaxID=2520507 RepID=UPI003736F4D5
MRIKHFEFDIANSTLVNSQTQAQYHLTRTESQVLEQLANHPNQVLTKGQLACAGSLEPVMSGSAVAKAVFTLRKYFGQTENELIETVPKKGYRLNLESAKPQWQYARQKRQRVIKISMLVSALLLAFGIGAMHKYIWFKTAPSPVKDSRSVILENDQQVELIWLRSPQTSQRQIEQMEQKILSALNMCSTIQWRYVYLAFSNDMQVLNISMEGHRHSSGLFVRNIKTSDFTLTPTFISESWLEEVSLCE